MNHDKLGPYIVRDRIMKLLSDQEVASVSTAETKDHLTKDEAYLDLEHLELGVRHHGTGEVTPMGRVLAKKAVRAETWGAIQALLADNAPGAVEPPRLA